MTASGGTLFARKAIASLAIASTVLLGASGCSLKHDVASLQEYAPSDGAQVTVGDLKLRNAFILTNGSQTALFGSIVNGGAADINAGIQYKDASGSMVTVPFPVFAGEKLDLGYNGTTGLALSLSVEPGQVVAIWLTNDAGTPADVNVPVLDAVGEYADLLANLG